MRRTQSIELGVDNLQATVSTWGGYLTHLRPDGHRDVVLSHSHDGTRRGDELHLGCLIGRHANRIRDGSFELDGWQHRLQCNAGSNHLHGGYAGFGQQVWAIMEQTPERVRLEHHSPSGTEGYPGNLHASAVISVAEARILRLELEAVSDAPTPVNLTWHPYFNLDGHGAGSAADHLITIDADHYLPMTGDFCPTGEITAVSGTPFDLRSATRILDRLDSRHPQIVLAEGFDHCFVIRGEGLRRAARLTTADERLAMEVWSTQPGLQFYTGNTLMLPGGGKDGVRYRRRSGICLEPQGFPDAPNHAHFPSTVLRPGERYQQVIEYRFHVS